MRLSLGLLLALVLFFVCWDEADPRALTSDAAAVHAVDASDRSWNDWWKSLKGEKGEDDDEDEDDEDVDDGKKDWDGYGSFWCWWKNTNGYVIKTEEDYKKRLEKEDDKYKKRLEKFKKWEEANRQRKVVYIPYSEHKDKGNVHNETIDGVNYFYTPWFWLGAGKWWY